MDRDLPNFLLSVLELAMNFASMKLAHRFAVLRASVMLEFAIYGAWSFSERRRNPEGPEHDSERGTSGRNGRRHDQPELSST
jgi:hypothetical protein